MRCTCTDAPGKDMQALFRYSLLLSAPRQLTWVKEPLPLLKATDVLVRTRTGAVSIGTELPYYVGAHRGSAPVEYPRMTGYESVGKVVARGTAVRRVRIGDRVVASYGHRTHAVLPASRLIPVPEDISDAQALLSILACDTAKGVAKMMVQPDERVLITGAGAIGLLTLFNLRATGTRQIDMVEPLVARRDLARRMGASRATTQSAAVYDVGFECSARDAAFGLLQRRVDTAGRICVLSDGNLEPLTLRPEFHEKELQVIGSSDGLDYAAYAEWFWDRLREGHYALDWLFERSVSIRKLPPAFDTLATEKERPLKLLVHYRD